MTYIIILAYLGSQKDSGLVFPRTGTHVPNSCFRTGTNKMQQGGTLVVLGVYDPKGSSSHPYDGPVCPMAASGQVGHHKGQYRNPWGHKTCLTPMAHYGLKVSLRIYPVCVYTCIYSENLEWKKMGDSRILSKHSLHEFLKESPKLSIYLSKRSIQPNESNETLGISVSCYITH